MLTLVTHCWSPPALPFYADALAIQLWSLQHYLPDRARPSHTRRKIRVNVVYTPEDELTKSVIDRYQECAAPHIEIRPYPLSRGELFRRSIARNRIGRSLGEDVQAMLCLDADMAFGDGCLESLMDIADRGELPELSCPREHLINKTHAFGDEYLARMRRDKTLPLLDRNDFEPKKHKTTLGGLMIIRRDVALEGYLDEPLWQKPSDPDKGFAEFLCDTTARRRQAAKGRQWVRLDLPNWFRIRHSRSSLNLEGNPKLWRMK